MTVLQDESKSPSCPVAQRIDHTNGDAMVTMGNRTIELALMDGNINTCLDAFDQGRNFRRLAAFIYVQPTVNSLRIQLSVAGLPCVAPGLVLYHQTPTGELNECSLTTGIGDNDRQVCGFVCHNVCPDKLLVRVYIQVQRWSLREAIPVKICEMIAANYTMWKDSNWYTQQTRGSSMATLCLTRRVYIPLIARFMGPTWRYVCHHVR